MWNLCISGINLVNFDIYICLYPCFSRVDKIEPIPNSRLPLYYLANFLPIVQKWRKLGQERGVRSLYSLSNCPISMTTNLIFTSSTKLCILKHSPLQHLIRCIFKSSRIEIQKLLELFYWCGLMFIFEWKKYCIVSKPAETNILTLDNLVLPVETKQFITSYDNVYRHLRTGKSCLKRFECFCCST